MSQGNERLRTPNTPPYVNWIVTDIGFKKSLIGKYITLRMWVNNELESITSFHLHLSIIEVECFHVAKAKATKILV